MYMVWRILGYLENIFTFWRIYKLDQISIKCKHKGLQMLCCREFYGRYIICGKFKIAVIYIKNGGAGRTLNITFSGEFEVGFLPFSISYAKTN